MKAIKKPLKTLIDYKGRMWTERADGSWTCYDDETGKTQTGLLAPEPDSISLDAQELNRKK
jgi:hypothetical protein